jgi:phage terminase large subunit GpA-like protein
MQLAHQVAEARGVVNAAWTRAWAPPPALTVSEWADENRVLSSKASSEPGPWSTTRTPYLRELMDCLSATSAVEEVVFMKGAQIGGTEAGNNWIGYVIDIEPAPIMMVQPTTDTAKRYSKQRITPMLEDTPSLRDRVRENRSRDDANTTLMKDFQGGVLVIAGANSAAGLRSMPVRFLFLDEIDAYPHDVDGEGDPVALAEKRTSTFARRKVLKVSTPTLKDFSKIEAAYLASDRRHYYVPCPHCGEMDWLRWPNIRWPQGFPQAAYYVCEHCGGEIGEHHKNAMLAAGEWRAAAPGAQNGVVAGFHLSSLYSPLGWESWGNLAQQFIDAKHALDGGDDSSMKAFVNTALAETWEDQGERVASSELARRAEAYALRTVPSGGLLLTAGIDVQGDRIEVQVDAWGRGEESWTIDYVAFVGDPPKLLSGEDARLDEYLNAPLRQASGSDLRIMAAAIDTGHYTHDVYQFVRVRQHRHIFAVKGSSLPGRPVLGKPSDQDVNYRGVKIKRGAKLWLIGTDTAKALIYSRLRVPVAGPGYVHFSKDLPEEYYAQLTAERLVTRYVKGHAKSEWVKANGKRNEALDTKVYSYAAACYLGVPRKKAADWDALERLVQPKQLNLLATAVAQGGVPDNPSATAADAESAEAGPTPQEQTASVAPVPRRARSTTTMPRKGFVTGWKH